MARWQERSRGGEGEKGGGKGGGLDQQGAIVRRGVHEVIWVGARHESRLRAGNQNLLTIPRTLSPPVYALCLRKQISIRHGPQFALDMITVWHPSCRTSYSRSL